MFLCYLWHWNMAHKHTGLIINSRPQLFQDNSCRELKSILHTEARIIFQNVPIMSFLCSNFSGGFLCQNKILPTTHKCVPLALSWTTLWLVHSAPHTLASFPHPSLSNYAPNLVFAVVVLSTSCALSSDVSLVLSCTWFKSLLQCPLTREAIPKLPRPLPQTLTLSPYPDSFCL